MTVRTTITRFIESSYFPHASGAHYLSISSIRYQLNSSLHVGCDVQHEPNFGAPPYAKRFPTGREIPLTAVNGNGSTTPHYASMLHILTYEA